MRLRFNRKSRSGGAIMELAIVLPVFVLLIFGQIEAARLGMVAQLLSTAAREGCRIAVINGRTNDDVTTTVDSYLKTAGISNVTITQYPADCTTVRASDNPSTISLTLSVPYSSVSWLPAPYFLKNATITATAVMSSERP